MDISSATPQVAPDLLKALSILSDATIRRSAVDREDLKTYWKSEKRPHFSRWSTILLVTSFSKTLLTTERRLKGWYFLAVDLSPAYLKTGTTDGTFQQSWKQDWRVQLVRKKVKVQSGPDAIDKSRFVMTFLTILGVTEILCSFRLVLEEKAGKEIPKSSRLEFLEKFPANNFVLSDTEDNTSGSLNRGGIPDLTFLRVILAICKKSREPSSWEVMGSFVLLAYASLTASKTLLRWLLAYLNFTIDSDLFC